MIDDEFLLTEKACTVLVRQLCQAMEFMHTNNIIHLDLKPENILCLTREGNRIKIIDFGLARRYDPDKKLQVRNELFHEISKTKCFFVGALVIISCRLVVCRCHIHIQTTNPQNEMMSLILMIFLSISVPLARSLWYRFCLVHLSLLHLKWLTLIEFRSGPICGVLV